ncbi:TIR domain-containing protein, partial [Parafrankia sp. BMG5.11]|uniref:TIR domain-containing protein n=1 Tax=Parafrankia sp. BMG5.11 TaxID=222540 RepID=UPI00103C9742
MSNGGNTDSTGDGAGWDFFVSYTQTDRPWAEWIAWTLEEANYQVLIQAWDLVPGSNWVTGMDEGATRAARTIAVLSHAYTRSVYGAAEWRAAWASDPTGATRKLLVTRVEDCPRPGLLGQVVSLDLFGIPHDQARSQLLHTAELAVSGGRAKPAAAPPFPTSPQAPTPPPFPASGNDPGQPPATSPPAGGIHIGTVTAPGGQAIGINYGQITQGRDGPRPMTPSTTPDGQHSAAVEHVSAPDGQAIGVNHGQVWQQRFSGPFQLLRHATIPLDPLPGDLRLTDPANPDNPVARFQGREELIGKIDAFVARCVQQRRGGYLLIEAEAGMGKSALATYLAYTRTWPAHFTRLPDGRIPERARRNLAAQLIAHWQLQDAAPGGVLPDDADTTTWLYGRLCDAARTRDHDQPVVLLVDGLDEAPTPPPGELPLGLPTALPPGTIIIATTRPKTVAVPTGTRVVERIDVESTSNRRDLLDYLTAVTAHDPLIADALHRAGPPADRFCRTLLDRSGGVWIYALTVLDQIRDHDRDPNDVGYLPEGLAGYYADNVHRWCTEVGAPTWQNRGLPLLATLTAIREPQTAAALAQWAGVPEHDTHALLRGILRPFLAVHRGITPREDRYQPRHQSLRDFVAGTTLTEGDDTLRDLADALGSATRTAHQRIALALTPPEPVGQRIWQNSDDYTRTHLPEHAAHAGTLDQLVNDHGFLLACHSAGIMRHRHRVTTPAGHAAMNAYTLFLSNPDANADDPPLWSLHVWARKTHATALADIAGRHTQRAWTIQTAIWNGTAHHTLTSHTGWMNALAVLPGPGNITLLATASGWDGTVRLWDPTTGQPHGEPLTGHTGPVNALAVLPGPGGTTLLATAGNDRTVRLWNPTTGQPHGEPLTGHTRPVKALAVLPGPGNITLLATASDWDGTVRLWDPTTGQPHGEPLTGHTGPVNALTVLPGPDGTTLLATASNDQTVRLWNPTTSRPVGEPLTGHTGPVNALAVLPGPGGTTLLATAGGDRTVRLWNPTSGQQIAEPLTGPVTALAVLPGPDNTTLLATASNDQTVRLWNPTTGQPHGEPLTGHTDDVTALAVLPGPDNTTLLATASNDQTVRLWNPTTGQPHGEPLTGHTGPVNALAVLPGPDGTTLLATASNDQTVRLWNPTTGRPVGELLTGHTGPVNALAVLPGPDGTTLLATASNDQTVRLWNPTVGEPFAGYTGPVNALAVLPGPDGTTATASNDERVRLWNPTT